ncbi:MAG TPA: hypothetical protein VFE59_27220 [Trebonia sp.]|nr:hypothetical protein [Trebonia sp.]
MSGGTFRTHSGLRAVINAWLEDISFRTGMITGAVALLVIAAVGAAVAVPGHSGQAASALGSRGPASSATVAPSAAPSSAAPARSARATPAPATPAPARSAASAPGTGSPPAGPAAGSGTAAASGASRESYGPAGPAGWRHGFPPDWGERGWAWGPYRSGPHFGGRW